MIICYGCLPCADNGVLLSASEDENDMPERLKKRAMRVVGARQTLRAIREGNADKAFLAMDADARLRQQVEREAKENGVPLQLVATMEELSSLCRVDVPSAAAAILKNIQAADSAIQQS